MLAGFTTDGNSSTTDPLQQRTFYPIGPPSTSSSSDPADWLMRNRSAQCENEDPVKAEKRYQAETVLKPILLSRRCAWTPQTIVTMPASAVLTEEGVREVVITQFPEAEQLQYRDTDKLVMDLLLET